MQYINSQLGIRVKQDFNDMKYLNAGGRGKSRLKKAIFLALSPTGGIAFIALSNSDKSRYKTVMGSISNPPSHLIKDYYAATKRDFPFDANMSSEQLQSIVDKLTTEYGRWDVDRDTKAATVAKNRNALDKGNNKQTIAELAAVRSWMQAINDYRAEVIKAYDKAFAREEKAALAAEEAAADKAASSTKITQTTSTGAALSPIGEAQGQAGSGGIVTGPISEAIKGDVKVGGTQVKKSYLVFGGLALGVLGFLYFRNK